MMIKLASWLAIAFGLALAVLEVVRNWGDWEWWPFWVVDYVAATLLILGGAFALRRRVIRWLAAGWGFTCAMFWMSFFGHYEGLMKAGSAASAKEQRLTLIIGIMFVVTLVGVASSLGARSQAAEA